MTGDKYKRFPATPPQDIHGHAACRKDPSAHSAVVTEIRTRSTTDRLPPSGFRRPQFCSADYSQSCIFCGTSEMQSGAGRMSFNKWAAVNAFNAEHWTLHIAAFDRSVDNNPLALLSYFFADRVHPKHLSNAAAERFAGIATLVVLFAAPALPIYLLFRKQAVLAAMIIGWFPLLVSTALAYRPNRVGGHGLELVFAVVEGIACWGAVVLGVWLASCLHAATSPPS